MAAGKKPEDQLFETMDAQDVNKRLKDLMDGLTVKVPQPACRAHISWAPCSFYSSGSLS